MPIPQGFQRARLEIDGGDAIECAFNPQSYTVSKTNIWNFKPTTGVDLPPGEFGGGLPRRTTLSLLLDVSLLAPDQSVKDMTNKLLKMMETGGGGGGGGGSVPPFVTFRWGSVDLPKSVPVSLTIQHTLFHPNGEPIRATVDLELAQAEKASTASSSGANQAQNPTTRAAGDLRVHRVRDGDSLPAIAYDAYGDATRWRVIAEANGIDDPLRLRRGAELTIPRVPT
ncbi:LysM peptidoglycan-binding domain-containing protein [Baekduia soli]|uniref:LysM peptidoglycan-binding domain-containing protein n=1 Tax=Baekduia soli TaxID=496014 RepID=A0A5B8U5V1_9ACTN|nr:LysM peptidoglycan-binding domain-containing protein [Baekduia soli]QEC48463.1 LysM peptidoglycan-binding domain-containing protein [Baekduia soli]